MARRIKTIIGDFVKSGAPTTVSSIGAWNIYDRKNRNYFEVNTGLSGKNYKKGQPGRFWNDYLPYLSNQLKTVVDNSEMIYQSKFPTEQFLVNHKTSK